MTGDVLSVWMSVVLCCVIGLVTFWGWFRWRYQDLLRAAANLPVTYPTLPFLGHAHLTMWGLETATYYAMEMATRSVLRGFKAVCFWCGPYPYIIVTDVDDVQLVMNSPKTIDKGAEYEYFKMGLDSGVGPFKYSIVTAPGPIWKITRRHMNSLFVPRLLDQMMPVFNRNSRILVDDLSEHVDKERINIIHHTMDIGLKTVCNLLFGPEVHIDEKTKEFQDLKNMIERIPEIFIKRMVRPWLKIDQLFYFIYRDVIQKMDKVWKNFTEAPLKVTKDISKQHRDKMVKDHTLENCEDEEVMNIVDAHTILREKYPQFTEADMRFEMLSMYVAGSDTIGSISAYCLLSLAQYPHIQEKLYREIISVMGTDDDVTYKHIARMPYLDQVIKETLRRFTLVPFLLRRATEDMKLSSCTIPAGNTVIISLGAVHMNPNIYPDPQKFDPDRFSPENVAKRDKSSFIPFSGGPRICIGKKYAMLLMKVMLVHILRTYRFKPVVDVQKLRMKLVVAMVSIEGYPVALERRVQTSTS